MIGNTTNKCQMCTTNHFEHQEFASTSVPCRSDHSISKRGWRLCPPMAGAPSPTEWHEAGRRLCMGSNGKVPLLDHMIMTNVT